MTVMPPPSSSDRPPIHPCINETRAAPAAAYLHIPFCRRRCFYCDFPISVVGDARWGDRSRTICTYVQHLCQEIAQTPIHSDASSETSPLETVFFGGGTPSLLSVGQLEQILAALRQRFGIAFSAEVSMEMDPGTFDLTQIQGYAAAGITRVSLGAQAFQSELLAVCGRTHTSDDIPQAVALLRQAGIENFSLDLISGLPGLTMAHWQESLERAIALNPTHLSIYDLTIEPGTVFGKRYTPGEAPLPSDDATTEMYRQAHQTLTTTGYDHYEISNYAKPGYACRHNRVYWENRPYYAMGMAAASYVQGQRFTRPRTREAYYAWLESGALIDCTPTPLTEQLLDTLMLGLRLREGVSVAALCNQFGEATVYRLLEGLHAYVRQGLVQIDAGDRLRLTVPDGFLLSNTVLAHIFHLFS